MADTKLQDLLEEPSAHEALAIRLVHALKDQDGQKVDDTSVRTLTIERQVRSRPRKESPRRQHSLFTVDGLTTYLLRYGSESTVVLIDIDNDKVHAVLDERATHGFELVTLHLRPHPRTSRWLALVAKKVVPLRDLVTFLREQQFDLLYAKPLLFALAQVRASKEVTLFEGHGSGSTNGILVKSKVGAGAHESDIVELPESIAIEVPFYLDSPAARIEIGLVLDVDDKAGVVVRLIGAGLEEARLREATRIEGILRDAAGALSCVVAHGSPRHQDWEYAPDVYRS